MQIRLSENAYQLWLTFQSNENVAAELCSFIAHENPNLSSVYDNYRDNHSFESTDCGVPGIIPVSKQFGPSIPEFNFAFAYIDDDSIFLLEECMEAFFAGNKNFELRRAISFVRGIDNVEILY